MRAISVTAAAVLAAGLTVDVHAQPAPPAGVVIDVPYLSQSEALCGGAAAAMVMRYWGAAGVTPETFSDLVDRRAGGIHQTALADALRTRGWRVQAFRGGAAVVRAHLAARRPAIAMIEERPGVYHYVVIVGWPSGRVIVHDPARTPFRVLSEGDFMRRWQGSDSWTMVAIPAADVLDRLPTPAVEPERSPDDAMPASCRTLVADGVRFAGEHRLDDARRALDAAIRACPDEAAPWREMAGLHALEGRWLQAVHSARQATVRDREDALAWRILATGLFLEGDLEGALAAWNRIGEPVIDLVTVQGLARTRHDVATRAMGLSRQELLTPDRLRAASRRLADLPAAKATALSYQPREAGYADVRATVTERSLFPNGLFSLGAIGVRALADRELAASVASPTGGGELVRASWRWADERPRIMVGLSAPAPFGGVWSVSGLDERQSYGLAGSIIREARQNGTFEVSDWTSRGFKWIAGAGIERFRHSQSALSLSLGGEQRYAKDRVSLSARTFRWFGEVRTWTAGLQSEWRSGTVNEGVIWSARGGVELAGDTAPLTLWPGAGSGLERAVVLRAHPVHENGVVTGETFGRRLVYGSGEWRRWTALKRLPATRFAPAVFVDTGRSFRRIDGRDGEFLVDAGIGIRVALPSSGLIRLDVARGLRDGSTAVSVGWTR